MKLSTILSDSRELLQIGIDRVIETPKPALTVYSYTFAAGFSTAMDWVVGILPNICMFAGFVGTVVLAQANWKKGQREGVELETAKMQQRIVLEQMRKMELREGEEDANGK